VIKEQVQSQQTEEDAGSPNRESTHDTNIEVPKRARVKDARARKVAETHHKTQVPHDATNGLKNYKRHTFHPHKVHVAFSPHETNGRC
jgi:hypothetical protein